MEKFSEILKQFNSKQRIFVLILLLIFSSGTYLVTNYFKVDDCKPVIEKNKELINYIVQIQDMILIYKNEGAIEGTTEGTTEGVTKKMIYPLVRTNNTLILDSIMMITQDAIIKNERFN